MTLTQRYIAFRLPFWCILSGEIKSVMWPEFKTPVVIHELSSSIVAVIVTSVTGVAVLQQLKVPEQWWAFVGAVGMYYFGRGLYLTMRDRGNGNGLTPPTPPLWLPPEKEQW